MIDSGNYFNPEGAPISCSCHAAINQSTSCSWHAAYWSLVGAGPGGFGLGLDINVTVLIMPFLYRSASETQEGLLIHAHPFGLDSSHQTTERTESRCKENRQEDPGGEN